MASLESDPPPWSGLPHHILGLVIERLASSPVVAAVANATTGPRPTFWSARWQLLVRSIKGTKRNIKEEEDMARFRLAYRSYHTDTAADCARFRAVCRSWRAAVHEHMPHQPRRLPWTVLDNGSFLTGISDDKDDTHSLPSWPKNAKCIGATNDWLAIQCAAADGSSRSYFLHNPFSTKRVPLPEIDAIIGNSTTFFEVRKVVMRSSQHDVVAFLTNNYNYPIILVRPGRDDVWLPRPRSAPFIYIIDIVFVGDKLYGITNAEDLISLDIAFDHNGKPTVTRTKRVIRHKPQADDLSVVWGDADFNRVPTNVLPLDDAYDLWSDVDENYRQDDNVKPKQKEILPGCCEHCYRVWYNRMKNTGDGTISEAKKFDGLDNYLITTTSHIIESLGKLLMVRRQLQYNYDGMNYTRSADVLEADITTGAWMAVTDGLDGQALFISKFNCKCIDACGEVEKDAVYVVDTGDALDMKSWIISQPQRDLEYESSMWIFPPEIVI